MHASQTTKRPSEIMPLFRSLMTFACSRRHASWSMPQSPPRSKLQQTDNPQAFALVALREYCGVLWPVWSNSLPAPTAQEPIAIGTTKPQSKLHRSIANGVRAGELAVRAGQPASGMGGRAWVCAGVRMGMCRGWGYAFEALDLCFCRRN